MGRERYIGCGVIMEDHSKTWKEEGRDIVLVNEAMMEGCVGCMCCYSNSSTLPVSV